ncbi:hypothetical protein CS542_01045 [Pedobacter sp. IW39]|nr:hypothetical protein CS542_01045 [Pedobacter sp. IW39]
MGGHIAHILVNLMVNAIAGKVMKSKCCIMHGHQLTHRQVRGFRLKLMYLMIAEKTMGLS